jgi:hypothetical protein
MEITEHAGPVLGTNLSKVMKMLAVRVPALLLSSFGGRRIGSLEAANTEVHRLIKRMLRMIPTRSSNQSGQPRERERWEHVPTGKEMGG